MEIGQWTNDNGWMETESAYSRLKGVARDRARVLRVELARKQSWGNSRAC